MEILGAIVLAIFVAKWLMSLGAREERERIEAERAEEDALDIDPELEAQLRLDEYLEDRAAEQEIADRERKRRTRE